MSSMNVFMQIQCRNMISSVDIFLKSCELAAKKDDGLISNDELKTLNEIRKAASDFILQLETLIL